MSTNPLEINDTREGAAKKDAAAEMDVLCQTRTVTLGGKGRTLKVKSISETREFRRKVGELLGLLAEPLVEVFQGAGGKVEEIDLGDAAAKLLPVFMGDGLDTVIEMLWLYAPELEEFRVGASDDEIMGAAMEVIDIAYPLVLSVGKQTVALLSRAGLNLKP